MTDHASLLRQIDKEAEPYIEQWLDLADVFAGFRKLATANGLDWGQVKGLLKARAQDRRDGSGSKRVNRIIEKADFAAAYADMLGLGSTKMNEKNFSSGSAGSPDAIPHDPSTGELIDPPAACTVHEVPPTPIDAGEGQWPPASSTEPAAGLNPAEGRTAPVPDDSEPQPVRGVASEAEPEQSSPTVSVSHVSQIVAATATIAPVEPSVSSLLTTAPGASPFDDMPDIPDFLRRSAA